MVHLTSDTVFDDTKHHLHQSSLYEDKSICDIDQNLFADSHILADEEQIELSELITLSLEIRDISFKSTKLIFNAKQDGFTHHAFYSACSNKRNTLIIIQSYPTVDNDYDGNKVIFGAFTSKEWKVNNQHVYDDNAFLYRLRANEYGARVFRIKEYEEFALYQAPAPSSSQHEHELFYFGQPTALLLSEHCDQNEHSYCGGGARNNYDIPFKGSLLGERDANNFRVISFEVFHFV